jgi:hypothetical protein
MPAALLVRLFLRSLERCPLLASRRSSAMEHSHPARCFSIQMLAVTYSELVSLVVCKHAMLSMLLFVVMQDLAELSKEFVAGPTVIGIIGSPTVVVNYP